MPDLSQVPTEDLEALSSGDFSKVSDETLAHLAQPPSTAPIPPSAGQAANKIDFAQKPSSSGLTEEQEQAAKSLGQSIGGTAGNLYTGAQAAGKGALNTMTAGYQPELEAGAKTQLVDPIKRFLGKDVPQESFVDARDRIQGENDRQRAASPLAYNAGALGAAAALPLGAGSALKGAGMAAGYGAISNPGNAPGQTDYLQPGARATNAALAGGTSALVGGAGKGLGKLGDFLMQKASGMTDYIPGVGTRLANEGIWGTKGMMQNQVNATANKYGQQLEEAIKNNIPGKINSEGPANEVADLLKNYLTSGGKSSSMDEPAIALITGQAREIAERGMTSAPEAHELSQLAGKRGYNFGDPLSSAKAQISQAEQRGYSNALKNADTSGEVAGSMKNYSELAPAKNALNNKGDNINQVLNAMNKIPGSSLGASTLGQAAAKGGAALQGITPPMIQAIVNARKQGQ